ncbi:hypothetical protein EDC05_000541 [Coemansia umbellata]|uniref:Uncharacterized protein n=1 Tax=Coemansia umbellata TaxID=1424467 RepID=A0ABQ8PVL2_9FUNG|nr:hypothetical protein EDC05_000541 [Coemansia umbellata]
MVLKELNTNKGFKLSPNSQIRAEKENFDPIKKQLIYYKRSNSKAVPLEEKMVRAYSRVVGERVVGVRANKLHHNNAIQSKYTVESHRFVNEYTTPTGVRVLARHSAVPANKYKKEAVVAGNRKAMDGNSSQHTFCAKPRREVDDLVQLLDGMDLSIESPVFASDKENEQQCVRDKALLRAQ